MREAELQAAREGRSVDNVEVDEEKAREDFLVFFEYVFTFIILSVCMLSLVIYRMFLMLNLLFDTSLYINSLYTIHDRDFFLELSKFGRLEALHICDNLGKQR